MAFYKKRIDHQIQHLGAAFEHYFCLYFIGFPETALFIAYVQKN